MADYSTFPFGMYSTDEIAQMFIESVRVSDKEFAEACQEEIRCRRPTPLDNSNSHAIIDSERSEE